MITKTFSSVTGSGLRSLLIAPAALQAISGTERRVTVIAPHEVLLTQWAQWLPDATFITPIKWLRRAEDADTDLIIADEMLSSQMALILSTLGTVKAEVWAIVPHAIDRIKFGASLLESSAPFPRISTAELVKAQGFNPELMRTAGHKTDYLSKLPYQPTAAPADLTGFMPGIGLVDVMLDSPPCTHFSAPNRRAGRIQQLFRDLAAKIRMVPIKNGVAEMFRPNCMGRPRPEARAAFARYKKAESIVQTRAIIGDHMEQVKQTEGLPPESIGYPLSLYMQRFGRVRRTPQPVQAYLVDAKTCEKIPGSDFTPGEERTLQGLINRWSDDERGQ